MSSKTARQLDLNDNQDARWLAKEVRRACRSGLIRAGGGCTQECDDACSDHGGCALCTGNAVVCHDGTALRLEG